MVSPILFDTSPKKNNILNNSSNNQKVVTKPILFGDVKPTDTDTDKRLTTTDLLTDRSWINASKQIYKHQTGKEFVGTDQQAAEWGIGNTADFEYDLTKTIGIATDAKNFDLPTAEAWNTVLDKYNQLEMFTLGGTGRALRYMATDPTMIAGLGLGFGIGGIAKQFGQRGIKTAAKFAVKEAVKQARKKAIADAAKEGITGKARKELVDAAVKKASTKAKTNIALLAGTETGAYSGVDNYYRQLLDVELDRRDGINALELGLTTGVMGALGFGLGRGLPAVARRIFKKQEVVDDLPDKIFSDKDTIDIAKQQTKIDAPISNTTKVSTRIAQDALRQDPNATVLSYGSGQVDEATGTIKEVEELKKSGAKVDAYDLEPNMVNKERTAYREQYNPYALDNKYNVVNASNVLDNLGSKQDAYNKARRIVTQISKSVKDNGTVVINPSKKSSITKAKLDNILNETFEKVEWDDTSEVFKASGPIEKVVVEVGEDGLPIKKQNKVLMFLKKNFSSDAGAGETIAQGRRLQKTTVKNAERKIQYNLGRLEKAVKKEYGSFDNVPPKLMSQLVAGVEGRLWELEGVLPQTKKILTDMRRSIDDAQQQLIDIGAVEPGSELQYKINRSQSTSYPGAMQGPPQEGESLKFYMNTSYDVFDNPKYKVNPKDREAGRQYFIDKLSQSGAAENAAYKLAKSKEANIAYKKKKNIKIEPNEELSTADLQNINRYEGQDGIIEGLINQLTEKHGDDITSQLDNLLGKTTSRVGSGALKILKAKENIDPEIAGLLGETKDIRQRYANTLLKLSKLAGNFEFNKSIRESAEQAGITVPTQNQMLRNRGLDVARIGQRGKYTQRVSDLVSDPEIEGLARPLQDVWTTQEFKDIIEQGAELAEPVTKELLGKLYDTFLVGKALTQISKTAYSIGSTFRNLYGAGMSALGNGYINPVALAEAGNAFKQVFTMPRQEVREKIEKLTALGVLDTDVRLQAMIELSKDIDSNFFLGGIKKYAPKPGKIINKKALEIYQSADNYWKWFAFLNEQGRYRQVLIDRGIDPNRTVRTFRTGGKVVNVTELDEYAAKMVRENMHNYGETSRMVKRARRSPFTDFIAFRTEMFRTSKNILKNGIKDMQEGAAQMKRGQRNEKGSLKGVAQFRAGMARIGGAAGAVTATGAIGYTSAELTGINDLVFGTNYTKKEAIEEFDQGYNKGSDWLYFFKNGKLKRFNISYIDPWAMFKNPVQAVIRAFQTEDDPNIALDKSTNQILKTFGESIGPSILTQALFDIWRNQDEFGREIAKDQGVVKDTANRLARLWEAFEPGTVSTARRAFEAYTKGGIKSYGTPIEKQAEILGFAGLKYEDVNIPKALSRSLIEPTQRLNESDKNYKKAFRDYRGTEPEVFIDLYSQAQRKKFRAAQDMYKFVQAAKATGMDNNAIIKEITKDGFFPKNLSKQFIRTLVKDGIFLPDKPENKTLNKWQALIKKTNKEAVIGLPAARKDLYDLYRQYSRLPLTTYEEEVIDYGNDAIID
jgi:hypothetical protein